MKIQTMRSEKGFTLLEIVVVMALVASIMAVVAYGINAGKKSSKGYNLTEKLRTVETGLYEYKSAKGSLPLLVAVGSFPAVLNSYVPSQITSVLKYKCDSATNIAVIRSDAMADATEATDVASRVLNSGVCTTATTNVDFTIDCALATFNGTAICT